MYFQLITSNNSFGFYLKTKKQTDIQTNKVEHIVAALLKKLNKNLKPNAMYKWSLLQFK